MTTYTFGLVNHANSLAGSTRFFGMSGNGEIFGAYLQDGAFSIPVFIYDNGSFTSNVDDPSHLNEISGGMINNEGDVLGAYSPNGFSLSYWFYNGSTYTDVADPLARGTTATGLSGSGSVVGNFSAFSGDFNSHGFGGTFVEGFIYDGSKYGTVINPLAGSPDVNAVNEAGHIAGTYTANAITHAYISTGGTWEQTLNNDGTLNTNAAHAWSSTTNYGAGDLVFDKSSDSSVAFAFISLANDNLDIEPGFDFAGNGFTGSSPWQVVAFVDTWSYVVGNGDLTTLTFPGSNDTEALRINSADDVLGSYADSSKAIHYFIYDHGTYTALADLPSGFLSATFVGFNASDTAVGTFNDGTSFVYNDGKYTTLTLPGSLGQNFGVTGIDDAGHIIGSADNGAYIATPGPDTPAVAIVWAKGVSGDFAVTKNWNPQTVPADGDYAALTPSGTYTVTSSADETIAGLITAAGATLNLTGGMFDITDGTNTIVSAAVKAGVNAGKITVGAGASLDIAGDTFANASTGLLQASGTGEINLDDVTIAGGTLKTLTGGTITTVGDTDSTLDGSGKGNPVTITGTITIVDNSSLTLKGAINNKGTIQLAGTGPDPVLEIAGNFSLQGTGGKVLMSDNANNFIVSNGSSATLNNVNNTISGGGKIGEGNGGDLTLNNQAAGIINGSAVDHALILDTGATMIGNAGTLEGSNTGGLEIDSVVNNSNLIEALGTSAMVFINADIDNTTKGVILASGLGAHVDLSKEVTIQGGTLKSANGGTIEVSANSDAALDGSNKTAGAVNNAATVVLLNGSSLTLAGTINNTGTFQLNGDTAETDLVIANDLTLSGAGGKVLMSDSDKNVITTTSASVPGLDPVLTNADTISGAGSIGTGGDDLTLVNLAAGIINANQQNNALVLNTGINNAISNLGTLEGSNTGGLDIESMVNNQNLIEALGANAAVHIGAGIDNSTKGVILASGSGAHVDLDGVTIQGGTLKTALLGEIRVVSDTHTTILDGTAKNLPVTIAGTIVVEDGTSLTLQGVINNTGTIAMADSVMETDLDIVGNFLLSGTGGKVTMTDSPGNVIKSNGSDATLNNVNSTISGAGTIGEGTGGHLTLNNQTAGIINGSGVHNALILDTGAKGIINAGILEGTNTGGLEIASAIITNSNLIEAFGVSAEVLILENVNNTTKGVILASGAGAHVDLNGMSIIGGTLKTALGGIIETDPNGDAVTLDGTGAGNPVNNTGMLLVSDGTQLTLKGAINNTGTIAMADSVNETDLEVAGVFQLQGAGGKVTMTDSVGNVIQSNGSDATLNNLNNSISGSGTIGEGTGGHLTLNNLAAGIVNGSGANNALILDTGAKAITNAGILEGSNTGGLDIESAVNTNSNLIEALGAGAKVTIAADITNTSKGVILASGSGAHVDIDGATITGGTLKTASGGVINVTDDSTFNGVTNAGTVNIADHEILTVLGTTLNNVATGVININDTLHTVLEIGNGGTFTLQGGGKVNMNGIGNAEIVSGGHAVAFVNADNTIAGSGIIGDGNMTLTNQAKGVIDGNDATSSLEIDGGGAATNSGLMKGTNAGGLAIDVDVGSNSGTMEALGTNARVVLDGVIVTNTAAGKIIASGTGAHVDMDDGTTIFGGTLSTVGTGVIETLVNSAVFFDGSTKAGVLNNAGSVLVTANSSLILKGTINNIGTMTVQSGADAADLDISGAVKLTGTGKITLSGGDIGSDSNPAALTNVGNTISGGGSIDDATNLSVDNQAAGVINATGSQALAIDVKSFSNEGKLEASGTGGLHIVDTTIANSSVGLVATLAAGAHIDLDGSNINGGSLSVFKGSTVQSINNGDVTVTAKITIAGTISANGGDLTLAQGFANAGTLDANNAHLTLQGAITGAGNATIEGSGAIEFVAASSTSNVSFAAGAAGALQLDHSLTFKGTVSGFAAAPDMDFSGFFAFGDSTIDSGWFPTALHNGDTANETGSSVKNTLISTAVSKGGIGDPVGFGSMNSEVLAEDFGYTAVPADAPGGGNNYAISAAVTIVDGGGTHQNTPAGGDTVDPGNGSIGNLNKNGALPSTDQQIENYLGAHSGSADPDAIYLVSTGGNDTTFANDDMPGDTKAQKQAYLMHQAEALADEIGHLQDEGAQTIVVHSLAGDDPTANGGAGNFATLFDSTLFSALDTAGVHYIKSDLAAMKSAVIANAAKFGLTTTAIGVDQSTTTPSAFINFDLANGATHIGTGWGQWGAPIGYYNGSGTYAYLRAPNAEYTSLYSDDQHFSTQGQQIEADYDLAQIFAAGAAAMDSIDLKDISYAFGTTTATYAGTKTGGTLTITDSVHHTTTKLTLSGDYTAANFITATDGHGGTAVIEAAPSASAQADVTSSHLLDAHYNGAIVAGMNYAVLDFTITKAVTLALDSGGVQLSSADVIQTNGTALTLTNNEIIHGGGAIGDAFMTLSNGAAGVIDADNVTDGMTIQTTGHAVANAGTIEATNGGWLRISNTTINNTATAHFTVSGSDAGTGIPSMIDLDHATINGGIVTVGAGAILAAVNGTTSTFSGAVTNSGMLEAFSNSHLTINGAVTGNGFATIGSNGTLEFGAAADTDVTFITFSTGNDGTLMLDKATSATSQFTGTVTNFKAGNDIDLGAINFTTGNAELSYNTGTNTLTVNDGTHHIDLVFGETHALGDFTTVQDANHHLDLLHV